MKTLSITFLIILLFASNAYAVVYEWQIADGGNGHLYEDVDDGNINWLQAKQAAESKGGYLATITSAAENLWVTNTFGYPNLNAHFLGGFQPPNSAEPLGDWSWVSGEPWNYTNWGPFEPNNSLVGEEEDALEFGHGPNAEGGQWNDIRNFWTRSGYVIEYNPANVNPGPSTTIPEPSTFFFLVLILLISVAYKRKFV